MSYLNPHTHKLDGQPTVVTICGSTRFRAEMTAANRDLTLAGCIVLAPGVFGHDGDEITEQQKVDLDRLHFQKIDMADAVFVVNPGGYIGESTRREIVYARRQGKRITALVALDDEADEPTSAARFGLIVDSDNGAHVRFRLFAAAGGEYLGGCGALVMGVDEFAAFRKLLEPMLANRPDQATGSTRGNR